MSSIVERKKKKKWNRKAVQKKKSALKRKSLLWSALIGTGAPEKRICEILQKLQRHSENILQRREVSMLTPI